MPVIERIPGRTRTATHYWRWSRWYGDMGTGDCVRVEGWVPVPDA